MTATTTPTPMLIDPVAEARRIAALLREHAPQADRDGRVPAASVQALRDSGLFGLYVPRALGGIELDPLTYAQTQEELARHDLRRLGAPGGRVERVVVLTRARRDRGGDLSGRPGPAPRGVLPVPMDATRDDGGFRLSGRRSFASNVSDASWVWVTAVYPDEAVDSAPVTRAAFLPAADVSVVRCWDTVGMRGTDSNDVELHDMYVPDRRTFRIGIDHTPGPRYHGPLYRGAAMLLVASYIPAVALGIAQDALDEVVTLAQGKTPFSSPTTLRDRGAVQAKLGRAQGALRSARAYLHDRIADGWRRIVNGDDLTLEDRAELLLASVQAIDATVAAVDAAFSIAGTTAIHRGSRLERHLRDIAVLKQQGFVSESRFETFAQVRLGLAPELGVVAL